MKRLEVSYRVNTWGLLLVLFCFSPVGQADVITEWNLAVRNIVVESKLGTPPANRLMAIVHTAAYESVNSITQEYPQGDFKLTMEPEASVNAAVASANRVSLLVLLPKQKSTIDKAYLNALRTVPDGIAKELGVAVGRRAAEAVLAVRVDDGSNLTDLYRPHTTAGSYVPTLIPVVPHWPNRRPWLLDNASQFRPGAPLDLSSNVWARDFNEVKEMGAANSSKRDKEQTNIAKFWEATLPPVYHGLVHSIANQEGRTPTQNARLFALVTQASDDALIAVFDAKYHYAFWRPITAIRNADIDGNESTKRDAAWTPYIPTPMHPEYPCAHCVVAATVGAIINAEVAGGTLPLLTTSSATANGATRSWSSIEDFVKEVSLARIYDGVHYRTSTEVGNAMGVKIGENAVMKFGVKLD